MDKSPAAASGAKAQDKGPALNIDLSRIVSASRVYIIEHFIVMASLVVSLIGGIGMYNAVIDHLMDEPARSSLFTATAQFEQLALYMAMALVAIPLFSLFYVRTRKTERAHPDVLHSRGRRRMSYVFVAVAFVFALGYLIGFAYTSTLAVISADTGATGESWAQSSLKQLFAVGYISLTALFVSRLTPGIDEEVA